jgi:hypothetical protein
MTYSALETTEADALELKEDIFCMPITIQKDEAVRNAETALIEDALRIVGWLRSEGKTSVW